MKANNSFQIIGHVGRDAEHTIHEKGNRASFSVAVDASYGSGEQRVEKANWFNVTAWKNQADFAGKHVKKGTKVQINGYLNTRKYTPAGAEKEITVIELVAQEITMLKWATQPTEAVEA